jgi:hypothetical protein
VETAVLVEGGGLLVDGVDGEVSTADPVAGSQRPGQSVEQQFRPEPLAVELPVKGEPSQKERWDRSRTCGQRVK